MSRRPRNSWPTNWSSTPAPSTSSSASTTCTPILAHNVTDVRGVLDPDGERGSHFTVIGDWQLCVSLEEEHIAILRAAAQDVGGPTGVQSELGNSIARTLYAVVIELTTIARYRDSAAS